MRPCSSPTRYAGKDILRQVVGHLGGGLQIDLRRLLDERIDDVRLPAFVELPAYELVDLIAPRLRLRDRLDRVTPGRHLTHDRRIEVAVGSQRERARNGRGGHDQDVWMHALRPQGRALHDAEAVLFVDDRQTQLAERDRLLHERVRADDEMNGAGSELGLHFAPLPRRRRAGQQREAEARVFQQPPDGDEVLLGEDFRRRHERHLETVLHRDERRHQRDDRLARADVALQEPVHRLRPLHVADDFAR